MKGHEADEAVDDVASEALLVAQRGLGAIAPDEIPKLTALSGGVSCDACVQPGSTSSRASRYRRTIRSRHARTFVVLLHVAWPTRQTFERSITVAGEYLRHLAEGRELFHRVA